MESFFASLQRELIHRQAFENREEAKVIVFEYVKFFYKTKRINSSLGYLTPGERMKEPCNTQTGVHISWGSP
jgi:putative transposase